MGSVGAGVALLTIVAVVTLSSGVSRDNPAAVATTGEQPTSTATSAPRPTEAPAPTLAPFEPVELPAKTIERGTGELLTTIEAGDDLWEVRRVDALDGMTCVEFIPNHHGGWSCLSGPTFGTWSVIGAEDRTIDHELITAEVGARVHTLVVSNGSTARSTEPVDIGGGMRIVAIAWPLRASGPLTLSFVDVDGQTLDITSWELGGLMGG